MLKGSASVTVVTVSIGHSGSGCGNDESALIPGAWEMGSGHSDADIEVLSFKYYIIIHVYLKGFSFKCL